MTVGSSSLPFVDLQKQRAALGGRIEAAVQAVLDHGQFIMGPEVGTLEDRLGEFCGAAHVVTVSSGTDALFMVFLAWGIGPGDAVFVPAFTFAATAEAVALTGATPIFVDVESGCFTMSAASLAAAAARLPDGLRPAAVVPVDLFGHPADYAALSDIARAHGMRVLADAAQSLGASADGVPVGRLGDATATSFFPAKPLGCYGDGGAVFTDDAELAGRLRSIRVHGQGADKYDNVRLGINGRLDTIQAAVLIEKLAVFDEEIRQRRVVAGRYSDALAGVVEIPSVRPSVLSAWAQYTIKVDRRDALAATMREAGVPTAVYYPRPLPRLTAFQGYPISPTGIPAADSLSERVLSLPMHPYLEARDQDRIVDVLVDAVAMSR